MCIKLKFDRFPEPIGQANKKLLNAYKALKSSNPLNWEVLPSLPHLSGFIGCKEEKAEELIKNGKITTYRDGDTECYVIAEVVRAINEDPEINRMSWESYKDAQFSIEAPVIRWIKWNFNDRILIKYLFKKETFYAFLPPELWRKNIRIGNAIIRLVNKNLKAQSHGRK